MLFYSAAPLPVNATFNDVTGVFSWTPDVTQVGATVVDFAATDGNLSTAPESVTITVLAAPNEAPVLNAVGNQVAAEGVLLQTQLSAFDPNGDTLIYTYSVIAPLPGSPALDSATGLFSWTPNFNQAGVYNG